MGETDVERGEVVHKLEDLEAGSWDGFVRHQEVLDAESVRSAGLPAPSKLNRRVCRRSTNRHRTPAPSLVSGLQRLAAIKAALQSGRLTSTLSPHR